MLFKHISFTIVKLFKRKYRKLSHNMFQQIFHQHLTYQSRIHQEKIYSFDHIFILQSHVFSSIDMQYLGQTCLHTLNEDISFCCKRSVLLTF